MSEVLAIDIGGTKIAGAIVDQNGHFQPAAGGPLPTPKTGGEDVAATVVEMVKNLLAQAPTTPAAIGIGSAGVIDPAGRRIVSATDAIPGWAGTALADTVEAAAGLPVYIENDVHAHARGEMWKGAGRPYRSAIMVAVGTGIGGALVQDRRILRGERGLAGHLGHLPASAGQDRKCSCGQLGHIEAIGAGPGMTSWYNDQIPSHLTPAADGRDLLERARGEDVLARTVVETAARATGEVIAGLVNAFDPQIVILGGGLAQAGEPYWSALHHGYQNQLMPALAEVPLVLAELESGAALLGAAALAFAGIKTK